MTGNQRSVTMEFVTEDRDYNVADIAANFKKQFPVLVKVTEGYCGNIEETFDKGEVLLVAATFKQKRVIARMNIHGHCRVLSIPSTFPEKLCLARRGKKQLKPCSLSDLLKNHEFPMTVQFPSHHMITAKNKSIDTSYIPPIELVSTFEDTYLLGNFVADGHLIDEVIQIPLYLSELRLSRVKGIKRLSDTEWHEFFELLKNESSNIGYDLRTESQYIAEYDNDISASNARLTRTTPIIHESVVDIFDHIPEVHMKKIPNSQSKRESLVSTSGRKSVRQLIQEWTGKISSIMKTTDRRSNRQQYQEHTDISEASNDTEHEGKHEHTIAWEDQRNNVKRAMTKEDDSHTQGNSNYSRISKRRETKSENLQSSTRESIECDQYQEERMSNQTMVEAWLENLKPTEFPTENLKPIVFPAENMKTTMFLTENVKPNVFPTNSLKNHKPRRHSCSTTDAVKQRYFRSLTEDKDQKQSQYATLPRNPKTSYKQFSHLHMPLSPKSLADQNFRALQHSPIISPQTLSDFYKQTADIAKPISPKSLISHSIRHDSVTQHLTIKEEPAVNLPDSNS